MHILRLSFIVLLIYMNYLFACSFQRKKGHMLKHTDIYIPF